MKNIGTFLVLCILFSCNPATHQGPPIQIDLASDIVIPQHYIVTKTEEAMQIDGKANEASWNAAVFSGSFIDIEGVKTPRYDTQMKMLWDENYLYVFAKMEEPHIWGDLKQRDTVIFYNNDFEVFVDPSGTGQNYGEIEINALGTVWDLLLPKAYRVGGKAQFDWNLDELKTAVDIDGTINDPSDIDAFWSVEMAIPMKSLMRLNGNNQSQPEENEQWRINFSRVEWDYDLVKNRYRRKKEDGKFLPEYNWVWSNQKVINMHVPERWGFLQFTHAATSENVSFIEDKDFLTKQMAYALFREINWGSLSDLHKKEFGFTQEIHAKGLDEELFQAIFYKTNFGFEVKLTNSISGHTFMINEGGILKSL